MKILIVYFKELKKEDLAWCLLQAGYEVQIMDSEISIYSTDICDANTFADYIRCNKIGIVLTYDFCPALSDGCEITKTSYVSWIYDCPQMGLYEEAVQNSCNYIYSFDKRQVGIIKANGAKNVYYQPLGTNVFRNAGIVITDEDVNKYSCDVSFIGNLFANGLYDLAENVVNDGTRNEYNRLIDEAYGKWDGIDRIHGKLTDASIEGLKEIGKEEIEAVKMDLDDFFSAKLLSYRLANKERIDMLRRLSKYDLKFFTGDTNISIPGVISRAALEYMEELPKAYYLSKININITLHSIVEGIPLRVFDIMGVGGFCLSNYQPAIEELFDIDKEIVVYRDLDEMEYKVKYYLEHENERVKILINGDKTVKER